MNPGDWRDEAKKSIANEKEVIINGVCVMNQSSDYKSDDGDDVNMEQVDDGDDESDARLTIAETHDEDEIKKSFIKKPEKASMEAADDVKVKKEVDEASAWEF